MKPSKDSNGPPPTFLHDAFESVLRKRYTSPSIPVHSAKTMFQLSSAFGQLSKVGCHITKCNFLTFSSFPAAFQSCLPCVWVQLSERFGTSAQLSTVSFPGADFQLSSTFRQLSKVTFYKFNVCSLSFLIGSRT